MVALTVRKKSLDLNSKFGNIAVAVIAILLAMTVYKQQKSNPQEGTAEEHNDDALKPELYQSLLA